MISLVLTPQFRTPPKPASHWRLLLIFLALIGLAAAIALIWPRKNTDLVHTAIAPAVLCFPEQLVRQIRQRSYRRASRTLTAEERRRVYLLQAGKLDLYRAEFGEPPAVVPAGGAAC